MPMDEQQKKNLMVVAAVGGGGLLLFMVMKNKGATNPPLQSLSPAGVGLSSGSYLTPFTQGPLPPPTPLPSPVPPIPFPCAIGLCRDPDTGMCVECGPGGVHHCPLGQHWDAASQTCVFGIAPPPGPPHVDCQVGYHWNGTSCVPDILPPPGPHDCPSGQYWCDSLQACIPNAQNCPSNSPIQSMKLPVFATGGKGGASPVPQVGKRTDTQPSAYNDGTDALYDWNLLSAYYAMRFH